MANLQIFTDNLHPESIQISKTPYQSRSLASRLTDKSKRIALTPARNKNINTPNRSNIFQQDLAKKPVSNLAQKVSLPKQEKNIITTTITTNPTINVDLAADENANYTFLKAKLEKIPIEKSNRQYNDDQISFPDKEELSFILENDSSADLDKTNLEDFDLNDSGLEQVESKLDGEGFA